MPWHEPKSTANLDSLFEHYGKKHGVEPDLLRAVMFAESSGNPIAVRLNPPHDVSVGLMQILCLPPDNWEGEDYVCENKFNISPWPVRFDQLKDPELNISLGAQILGWNIRNYGFPRGVAVYNMYSMRHASVNGPFENQAYVDKVLRRFNERKTA